MSHCTSPDSAATGNPILNPRTAFNLAAFNVRTLMQAGQQAALAQTLESLNIDVCCLSETRLQDSSTIITLLSPNTKEQKPYKLRLSGDPAATARGQAGVGIALSPISESALVDWFPVNSRVCAIRLNGSFKTAKTRKNRTLFVVAAYSPTNNSSDAEKDQFYRELQELLRKRISTDIVVLAGDMNAQVGRLDPDECSLGGRHSVGSQRNDNGERLLQLCVDNRLYLSSTSFRQSARRRATWRPPSTHQSWKQLDHIAVSYRWRGCVQDCRSYWNTFVDSDHALVCAKLTVRFSGQRKPATTQIDVTQLNNPHTAQRYASKLTSLLSVAQPETDSGRWPHIRTAISTAGSAICGTAIQRKPRQWISSHSLEILELRQCTPAGSDYNQARQVLRKRLKRSIRSDREAWWTQRASEMEEASSSGNFRKLFQLIRESGAKKPTVSETVNERDGQLIYNLDRRMERWVEHFDEQFNSPSIPGIPDRPILHSLWPVSLDPPSQAEVVKEINHLKRHKSPGPDSLHPALFKEGGAILHNQLTALLQEIWDEEQIPMEWGSATIIPIFKRGARAECNNHRGISLIPVVSKLLSAIILRRLTPTRELQIREEQAGFRPGRGCIDQIFSLRQLLERRSTYRRPTVLTFLDIKSAFDTVDRSALWDCLLRNGIPEKYINIIRALYAHTSGQVKVYGKLSRTFNISNGVRQGCPLSPFLFNFAIDDILSETIRASECMGVELIPGDRLRDLEYADDVVLACDTIQDTQNFLDRLTISIRHFGMRFAPCKCKVMLFDWQGSPPQLNLDGHILEIVEKFTYLGSCFSATVSEEVTNRISKARGAFANLHHLWRRRDIGIRIKGRVYNACVRSVLLYSSETWPSRAEDIQRLSVFDHRCIRSIARVWWESGVNNETVRQRVFGPGKISKPLGTLISQNKLRWLGHVLRMPIHRLPRRLLFAQPAANWRKPPGGQRITWRRNLKTLTTRLASVGPSRLPGWGPKDGDTTWLTTLADMAQNRAQWRICCDFLA